MPEPIAVALLGCGVVGTEVARLLLTEAAELAHRVGRRLELIGIAVADTTRPRAADIPSELLTTDADSLIGKADLVVEVIGGIEPAKTMLHQAIARGCSIVTANKALLAQCGDELFAAADAAGVSLFCEAAVAGAIPVMRPLRDSLSGDDIEQIMGIVNGTTNYILDEMHTTGADFADALRQAQELGYAETDPTADIEGFDAAAKAALLSRLAFHSAYPVEHVYREGISTITAADIRAAQAAGRVIKLLAICEKATAASGTTTVTARVHPVMIPTEHPLASVRGAYNAVFIQAKNAGSLMFYGPGAGGSPTASAVLGDLVTAARMTLASGHVPLSATKHSAREPGRMADVVSAYHIRLDVHDQPGVLADVATVFADHGVSIATLQQSAPPPGDSQGLAHLSLTTHRALERDLQETVEALAAAPAVKAVVANMRWEG